MFLHCRGVGTAAAAAAVVDGGCAAGCEMRTDVGDGLAKNAMGE